MLFEELMNIEHDRSGNISMEELNKKLKDTPESIKKQVYSDHGRKDEFQEQYKNIRIDQLKRTKRRVSASDIIECYHHPRFKLLNIDGGMGYFPDRKSVIRQHWDKHKTRPELPVFINSYILGKNEGLWLIEGHTRTGTLKGLIKRGIIKKESIHTIRYGDYFK